YPSVDVPGRLRAADIDGDGRVDLVVAHSYGEGVGYYHQQPNGTLSAEEISPVAYDIYGPPAVGDINGDSKPDVIVDNYDRVVALRHLSDTWHPGVWVRSTAPADQTSGIPTTVRPTITSGRDLLASSVSPTTVTLINGTTGTPVPSAVAYDATTRT